MLLYHHSFSVTQTRTHLSAQANGSLCKVLSLSLKVSFLLLKQPPFLFKTLLLLQGVAVMKKRSRLIVK